jgi:ribosomal protein L37E
VADQTVSYGKLGDPNPGNSYAIHCNKCGQLYLPDPWPDWDGRCPFCGFLPDQD